MPSSPTVQQLLDLVERNRVSADKMAETQLETAVSMEKLASVVAAQGAARDEAAGKRERFLFRALGFAIAVICLFAGVRVYDALEKSDKETARESRISAPTTYEIPAGRDELPPPPP